MNTTKNNKSLKISIVVLALLLVGLGFYTVKTVNENKETTAALEQEKQGITNELEALIVNYDTALEDIKTKDSTLTAAKTRIETLLVDVKDAKANVVLLSRYRRQIKALKSEKEVLFKRIDSLQMVNASLSTERDNTILALNESNQEVKSLSEKTQELSEIVSRGEEVKFANLTGQSLRERNNGKIIVTNKARRANKLKVCFTLTENAIASKGDKLLYLQVINPNSNVLGENKTVDFNGKSLNYSRSINVFYNNEALEVCEMLDPEGKNLIKGTYTINLFDGEKLVSASQMEVL
ncbi:MAG: hypothetical protein JKZ03_06740 [Flavobacteriaceae bacterium]|nr:hypothetical protein [Flavobacteriaceae bacterium]